ncbi:MAG: hypothetical protein L0958_03585 [Candidatus Mariimomonas ferrooxydans]
MERGGEMMRKIIGVLILLGALGFLAAMVLKIIHYFYLPYILGVMPTAYLKFSVVSLLLAIALSARELVFKGK